MYLWLKGKSFTIVCTFHKLRDIPDQPTSTPRNELLRAQTQKSEEFLSL